MQLPLSLSLALLASLVCTSVPSRSQIPALGKGGSAGQLLVDGQPFLVLGGELGNSSAGTAAQADTILPRMAILHVNPVLLPVAR